MIQCLSGVVWCGVVWCGMDVDMDQCAVRLRLKSIHDGGDSDQMELLQKCRVDVSYDGEGDNSHDDSEAPH
jgi:hypothetical protein